MTGSIGVDEISWRKHHKYLTLVSDHETGKIVWGAPGKTAATLDASFTDALPAGGPDKLGAVSMDLGPAFAKSVRAHALQAVICFDPFHVVKLATDALDDVRRHAWQAARTLSNKQIAKTYNKVRLIIRRAYGFHNAHNALAMIMLVCGPVTLELPYHT